MRLCCYWRNETSWYWQISCTAGPSPSIGNAAVPGQIPAHPIELESWAELELKLQAEVYKKSIRLQDFLAPFDRHHWGFVIEPNFERALASAGITLNQDNMNVIRTRFGVTQKSQALIAYNPFIESINTVFGPLNLEQKPYQAVIDGQKLTADYEHKMALSVRQPDKVSPDELALLKHTIQRIRDRIFKLRFDPTSRFRDFDTFNSGSVSKVQFHKCLTAAGFNFKDDVIDLLSQRYTSGRHIDHVDYREFLHEIMLDLKKTETAGRKAKHAATYIKAVQQTPVTMESIIVKIRKATSGYPVRFIDYLRDADPLRKNSITKSRLAAVLSSIGDVNLTDEETSLLQQVFQHDIEKGQINYQKLYDSLQDGFMLRHGETHSGSDSSVPPRK